MLYSIEEMKEKLNAILQAENAGVTSEILVDLQNNYTGVLSQIAELSQRSDKLAADNADLILANGKLFQSVGVAKEETATPEDGEEEPKSIEEVLEDMLDKRGNFKED